MSASHLRVVVSRVRGAHSSHLQCTVNSSGYVTRSLTRRMSAFAPFSGRKRRALLCPGREQAMKVAGRAKRGSFHPSALGSPLISKEDEDDDDDDDDEDNDNDRVMPLAAAASSAPQPSAASAPPTARVRHVLLLLLVIVGLGLGLGLACAFAPLHGGLALLYVVPNSASVAGSLAVTAAWLQQPKLRTAHSTQVVFLSLATLWYSGASLVFVASGRCQALQVAAAGWVASWLWSVPVSLDWLAQLLHHRGAGALRSNLLRWSHVCWPLSLGLAWPLLRATATPVAAHIGALNGTDGDGAPFAGWPSPATCKLATSPPSSLAPLFATFGVACLLHFGACCYGARLVASGPRVVWIRHRRRAASLSVAFGALHPPTLACFVYLASADRLPPPPLALWACALGAPLHGAISAIIQLAHEPGFIAWVRGVFALRGSCASRCCAAGCAAGCCASDASAEDSQPPPLAHTDSRVIHFDPRQLPSSGGANDPLRSAAAGGSAEMQALVQGILAEEAAASAESERCVRLCALPVALVIGAVLCVAMVLNDRTAS